MKWVLVAASLLVVNPAYAGYREVFKAIREWKPGQEIECGLVKEAYKLLGAARAEAIAHKKGASSEQIAAKKQECNIP